VLEIRTEVRGNRTAATLSWSGGTLYAEGLSGTAAVSDLVRQACAAGLGGLPFRVDGALGGVVERPPPRRRRERVPPPIRWLSGGGMAGEAR